MSDPQILRRRAALVRTVANASPRRGEAPEYLTDLADKLDHEAEQKERGGNKPRLPRRVS